MLKFSTKAETLKQSEHYLKSAKVLPQLCITVAEWTSNRDKIWNEVKEKGWFSETLIVRSSAINEDTENESMAGKFESVLDVLGKDAIEQAIDTVIASYTDENEDNQVLIQPMIKNVAICGVAFSVDPNNSGNYIIINYDDTTGSTESVTSGSTNQLNTFYYFKDAEITLSGPMSKVVKLVQELEYLFDTTQIDLEFVIDKQGDIYLLQVRPLVVRELPPQIGEQKAVLRRIQSIITRSKGHKPFLYGERTVYGVMPDWNPAEMIGIRPRGLAISLYKELITDYIWSYQRDNYGYNNLRSFPLLIDFGGFPYIDVRVSFNSFVPKELDDKISEKLINYYIDCLIKNKKNHDKVEFEIIFSCFTFDLEERIQVLKEHNFSEQEIEQIITSLKNLTNRIIDKENGFLYNDFEKIKQLDGRRKKIIESDLDKVGKIYWLLEDCKRYGTLPFAGLARGGFIAVQMLRSLKAKGILSEEDYNNFMGELDTISSQMNGDFYELSKEEFLQKYGHLRPGTYDILSNRYDEDDGRYFDWASKEKTPKIHKQKNFYLSLTQLSEIKSLLVHNGYNTDVLYLFDFFKFAIESREYAKFIFTKSVSDVIKILGELGTELGYSKEDMSYADIKIIYKAISSEEDIKQLLEASIREGKERYKKTLQLNLPPVIVDENDVWAFYQPELEPNYITLKTVLGEVASVKDKDSDLTGKIVFIESADPGYDWIFSKNIAGFVTMYGGANSHMAIRAGELAIPAIIGIGENKYNQYVTQKILEINCAAKNVRIIQ